MLTGIAFKDGKLVIEADLAQLGVVEPGSIHIDIERGDFHSPTPDEVAATIRVKIFWPDGGEE